MSSSSRNKKKKQKAKSASASSTPVTKKVESVLAAQPSADTGPILHPKPEPPAIAPAAASTVKKLREKPAPKSEADNTRSELSSTATAGASKSNAISQTKKESQQRTASPSVRAGNGPRGKAGANKLLSKSTPATPSTSILSSTPTSQPVPASNSDLESTSASLLPVDTSSTVPAVAAQPPSKSGSPGTPNKKTGKKNSKTPSPHKKPKAKPLSPQSGKAVDSESDVSFMGGTTDEDDDDEDEENPFSKLDALVEGPEPEEDVDNQRVSSVLTRVASGDSRKGSLVGKISPPLPKGSPPTSTARTLAPKPDSRVEERQERRLRTRTRSGSASAARPSPHDDEREELGGSAENLDLPVNQQTYMAFWENILFNLQQNHSLYSILQNAVGLELSPMNRVAMAREVPTSRLRTSASDFPNRVSTKLVKQARSFVAAYDSLAGPNYAKPKDTEEDRARDRRTAGFHIDRYEIGDFVAKPAYPAQLTLLVNLQDKSLDIQLLKFTAQPLPPALAAHLAVTQQANRRMLQYFAKQSERFELSRQVRISLPFESICGLNYSVDGEYALLVVDVDRCPSFGTRRLNTLDPVLNRWRARQDFTRSYASMVSRHWLFGDKMEIAKAVAVLSVYHEGIQPSVDLNPILNRGIDHLERPEAHSPRLAAGMATRDPVPKKPLPPRINGKAAAAAAASGGGAALTAHPPPNGNVPRKKSRGPLVPLSHKLIRDETDESEYAQVVKWLDVSDEEVDSDCDMLLWSGAPNVAAKPPLARTGSQGSRASSPSVSNPSSAGSTHTSSAPHPLRTGSPSLKSALRSSSPLKGNAPYRTSSPTTVTFARPGASHHRSATPPLPSLAAVQAKSVPDHHRSASDGDFDPQLLAELEEEEGTMMAMMEKLLKSMKDMGVNPEDVGLPPPTAAAVANATAHRKASDASDAVPPRTLVFDEDPDQATSLNVISSLAESLSAVTASRS